MHSEMNLFQVQADLIDTKVDNAVSKAIDKVVAQINDLKNELKKDIQDLRLEMNARFTTLENRVTALENRVTAIETKLGMINETKREIRTRFIDYSFKAGWLVMGALLSYVFLQLH